MTEMTQPRNIVEELNIPEEHRTTFIRALAEILIDFYEVLCAYANAMKKAQPCNFTEYQDMLDKVIRDSQGKLALYNEDVDFTDLKFEGRTPEVPYSLDEVVITINAGEGKVAYVSNYMMFAVYGIDGLIEDYNRLDVMYTVSKYMPVLSYVSLLTYIGMNTDDLYSTYAM